MNRIYFAGSIRGGRKLAGSYRELITILQSHGKVYTEHVGNDIAIDSDYENLTDAQIYERDMDWIRNSDLMVAEVSVPSLGVGYEIATALNRGIPVLCLYNKNAGHALSAMISGCNETDVKEYASARQAEEIINRFIEENTK